MIRSSRVSCCLVLPAVLVDACQCQRREHDRERNRHTWRRAEQGALEVRAGAGWQPGRGDDREHHEQRGDPERGPQDATGREGCYGKLLLNADGSFDYTPDPLYCVVDSFSNIPNDGTADSNVATVTITVNPVNDAPVADDDVHSTDEDTPLNVAAPGVLGNDSDVDGDSLTAVLETGPANGTLALAIVPETLQWVFQDSFGQAQSDPFAPASPLSCRPLRSSKASR